MDMVQILGAFGVGGLLWGLWVLLWRTTDWPVIAAGSVFLAGVYLFLWARRISLDLPHSVLRLDLWLSFFAIVAARVVMAVGKTGLAIVSGRVEPTVVAIPVPLGSELGRLLFLWAITVTPGTIALLVEGNLAYVHCLCRPSEKGLSSLTRLLERILG